MKKELKEFKSETAAFKKSLTPLNKTKDPAIKEAVKNTKNSLVELNKALTDYSKQK